MWAPIQSNKNINMRSGVYVCMYEIDKNASIEYSPRAPNTIARGDTEFRSQVFLRASVHGYIFIGISDNLNR